MPLKTVIAAVGVEVNSAQGPRHLGRTLSLALGPVRILWRTVSLEVGRDSAGRSISRAILSVALHGITTVLTSLGFRV